jgi:hypothetical protein
VAAAAIAEKEAKQRHAEKSSEGGTLAGKGRKKDRGGANCPTPKRDESKRANAVAAAANNGASPA